MGCMPKDRFFNLAASFCNYWKMRLTHHMKLNLAELHSGMAKSTWDFAEEEETL